MSELKVGDKALFPVRLGNSVEWCEGRISAYRSDMNKFDLCGVRHWGWYFAHELRPVTSDEVEAVHRIDKTIGTLEELHPEFSKVLHENFLELLGDDAHIENHINPLCKSKDVEKDKPMTFNEWLGTRGDMVLLHANCCHIAYEGGQQSQQAKVEELKASYHGEMIGHEVHLKKIKQERDELQTLYTQQGINMFKLQKRVDALEKAEFTLARIRSIVSKNLLESILIKEVRQALKGEG
ncbi:hypothetical protein ACT4X9_00195 [Acinetobacter baumannii]